MKLSALLTSAPLALAKKPRQEDGGAVPTSCSQLADDLALVNKTYALPGPFRLLNGKLKYELGYKPARPPILRASYNGTALEIEAGLSETNTVNFSVPIKPPTSPAKGKKKSPALIVYGGTTQVDQSSRNQGLFYDLCGTPNGNSTAGALMAWAWATSRVIDALEQHPEIGIDASYIGVTGCSRNGKGAMVAGAFDERIALTIPQESGSGGDACWRTSRGMLVNQNLLTQTAQEVIDENVWFASSFDSFGRDNYTIGLLPVDHHELAGLIAPRALYPTSNVGILWLGGWSCWECMNAANRIYEVLGVKTHRGISQDGPQ